MNTDFSALYEKQRQQRQRALEKQLAKVQSPEYQAEQREKSRRQAAKAISRQREKLNDPAYQQEQREKALERASKRAARPTKLPAKAVKKSKPIVYRERAKSANEKRLWDELGQLPCMACLVHGKEKHPVSIHHINGRTTENCHSFVVPLCEWHHDTPAPAEVRAMFLWLIPRHAKGSLGGKPAFEKANATEYELMLTAYTMIGRREEALKLLAL